MVVQEEQKLIQRQQEQNEHSNIDKSNTFNKIKNSNKIERTTRATTAAATIATTVRTTKRSYPSCLCKNSAAILNGPVPPMLWAQNALPSLIA